MLPWNSKKHLLGSNYAQAEVRLEQIERKLKRDPALRKEYQEAEDGLQRTVVPFIMMPYHVVIRPERETTKSRIVFDASAQIENDVSLSDCIETGPALLLELVSILIRFREHRVAIMAVIQKMYLQVKLNKEDRDVRYLWRDMDSGAPQRIMRMVTLLFGANPCPILVIASTRYDAERN